MNDEARITRNVEIKPATVDHAQEIARIHIATWRDAYRDLLPVEYLNSLDENARAERWRTALLAATPRVLIALRSSVVVGWIAFGPARDEDLDSRYAEIEAIYVASAFWNRGIGTALIDAACAQLRREGYGTVVLWVLKDNTAARAFYGQLGFGHDGSAKQIEIGGTPLMEMRVVRELVV